MHGDQPPNAATRKLQKVGGGTYTVSIPKEWATEQSLSAGETVRLYPDGDGSLVVCRDDEGTGPASATLPVGTVDVDALERTVRAAYVAGIGRLRLTAEGGFDDDRRRRIDRLVRERTGMRVVEASEGAIEIETILDDGEVSVPRTVVQLQFVTLSLFRTAVDLALDAGANGTDRIDDRRADATRLASLVTRQFGRSLSRPATAVDLGVDRPTAFECYRTAWALDRLATLSAAIAGRDDGWVDGVGVAADDGSEASTTAADLRSVAEGVRLYVEEATTAVVDHHSLAEVRDLQRTRADLSTLVAETDSRLPDASSPPAGAAPSPEDATLAGEPASTADPMTARRLLAEFEECARWGDRIAAVALESAIRRDG